MSYGMTTRRLWEMGCITDHQYLSSLSQDERDQLAVDHLDDDSYADYYAWRSETGPFDPQYMSPELRKRLGYSEDIE